MNKLKVLHFPLHDAYGGVTRYILSNWTWMNKEKIQFDLITRFSPKESFYAAVGENARVIPVCGVIQGNEEAFFTRLSNIMDEGYDIIHLHTSNWSGGFTLEKLAMQKKIPRVIVHSHGSGMDVTKSGVDEQDMIRQHEYYKKLFSEKYATDFVACSKMAIDWLFGEQIPCEKIKILHNAIDTDLFRFSPEIRECMRHKMGISNKLVIGYVGRLDPVKNPFYTLDVFQQICQQNSNAILIWVGTGSLEKQVHSYAKNMHLDIRFLGARDDISAIMQAFDCLLLPSRTEGLPYSVIEAQTAGLPCLVGSNVSIEAKVTPLLEFMSIDLPAYEWAEKLMCMVDGYKRRDYSHEVAEAGYDIRIQANQLERFYRND